MKKMVILRTSRTSYGCEDLYNRTMTVGELIQELREYSNDVKVVFSNDNGYTYGEITEDTIGVKFIKETEIEKD